MANVFSTSVTINAGTEKVWAFLTRPELMVRWMGDPAMRIEVHTGWQVGAPFIIRGFHHTGFENKGLIIRYEKEKSLAYTHLSSISGLADIPGHYTLHAFSLAPIEEQTLLHIEISNFPTESIRKHLEFYWRTTIIKIKRCIEQPFS